MTIDVYVDHYNHTTEIYVDGEQFHGRASWIAIDGKLDEVLLDSIVYGPDDVEIRYHAVPKRKDDE